MGRERADKLVLAERLEMACRGEVAVATVALGQSRVGDLADERLDEAVLASFGRPRIDLLDEDLAPDETAQPRLEIGRIGRGDGSQTGRREALAEHRGVLQEGPIGRVEGIETRRDERVERLRDGQLGQVADGHVRSVAFGQAVVGDQHPDRLDGIQGDAVCPSDDRLGGLSREPGHEPAEQLADRLVGERIEVERDEVPPAGSPRRASLEELRVGPG